MMIRPTTALRTATLLACLAFALLALVLPGALRAEPEATTNLLLNPGFESGTAPWICKYCALTASTPAHSGAAAGQMRTTDTTALGNLFQRNLSLQPNTRYELSFWARSGGKDLRVDLQQQVSPFTSYGLSQSFDVTTEWQQFTATFTTTGFTRPISNARLRFRAPRGKGLTFSIDDVSLVALSTPPPPTATPTATGSPVPPTPTATPTPTPLPPPGSSELVVFDWNKLVTTAQHGFPWDNPPLPSANGNWVTPVNFAEGTLYFRAEVRGMPSNKDMFLQFCFWQYRNTLENCGAVKAVNYTGQSVVVTWSQAVANLWKKDGKPIDWANPRDRNGVAIKNSLKLPVSDYSGWNWNGEDPAQWYPMDLRFTVVALEKGGVFSGWDNYIP